MAQVPLVDKSLSPKEAGHALALDRLLRFIVFGDECGHGQGVAGAQPGSPLGDAYETVKAEAVSRLRMLGVREPALTR